MSVDVAVLMPAYNADQTLRAAVNSILASTVPCDLYVIDDFSRVPVTESLEPRAGVEIIRLERNHGLAGALNAGLQRILARDYRYVARMDADDISYPERLAKQVAFLDQHPNVAVVGTWVRFIDEHTGAVVGVVPKPVDANAIRNALFFNSAVAHPTAMLRADVLRRIGHYSVDYPAAEDYELWRRIAADRDIANLPEVLLDYRVSSQGQSLARRRRQLYDRLRIQLKYFDAREWRAWAGAAQTMALFAIPLTLLSRLKGRGGEGSLAGHAGVPSKS